MVSCVCVGGGGGGHYSQRKCSPDHTTRISDIILSIHLATVAIKGPGLKTVGFHQVLDK